MFENAADLASRIDLACLGPAVSRTEVQETAVRAREAGFAALVLPPAHLEAAAAILEGSRTALCGVVAFPLGATSLSVKLFEALQCELLGAVEIDVVLNHAAIRSRDRKGLKKEVASIMEKTPDLTHKFILEAGILEEDELKRALKVLHKARPAFVKTGTGMHGPVETDQVRRLRKDLDRRIRIKAAGGVTTPAQVEALVEAGADRIGTSSGFEILEAWEKG
jgi:deoxyribose-phosphate aldolase